MKKLEKILGLIFVISLILKFTHIPGGAILCVLSLLTLACIYYPFGFALFNDIKFKNIFKRGSYTGLSVLHVIGAIGAGIALSIICIGILFKLQRWPGYKANLIAGLILSIIIIIIGLIRFYRNRVVYYRQIFIRFYIIGLFGLIIYLTPMLTIIKIQYRHHPEYINAYKELINDPTNIDLQKKELLEFHRATMNKKDFEIYQKGNNKE